MLVIPSDNEPCGDGGPPLAEYSCGGDIEDKSCSVRAVVATAFTAVGEAETDARGGSRAAENLEEEEPRDAREPGRSGDGICGAWADEAGCCTFRSTSCVGGEGSGAGGGGVVGGETSREDGIISIEPSGGAWASRRDNEDGPATGVEFARALMGKDDDVGGWVALKTLSNSDWGGAGGGLGDGSGGSEFVLRSVSGSDNAETFRTAGLRLFIWPA